MKGLIIQTMLCALIPLQALNTWFHSDRGDVRGGNKLYGKGNYVEAAEKYNEALEVNPSSPEALFNLSNAYYRRHSFDTAMLYMNRAAEMMPGKPGVAAAHYNAGNALFQQRKLQEALEAYKESLRKNPDDMDAKFNLAYVQKLLEEQNNQNDKNDDKQDQDQEQDKDQNQDQNQNQDQDQSQNNSDQQQDQQDQQSQQQTGMDRQEAERLLNAMQADENKTKEKVNEQKAASATSSTKNW